MGKSKAIKVCYNGKRGLYHLTIPDWQTRDYIKTICGKKIWRWWKEVSNDTITVALHRCCPECYKIVTYYEEDYAEYELPCNFGYTGHDA